MFTATPRRAATRRQPAAMFEPLESRQLLSTSSLTLVETKSTLPVAQLAGQALKGVVTVTATNGLTTPISGSQTFNVYGSTDGTIDASSVILGTVVKPNLKLGAGKTTTVTIPIKTSAPIVGDYAVYIQATDASGNTSVAGKAPDVSVAAAYVSPVATVGVPKPTALTAGKSVSFKVTIINNGNIAATGTLDATLELSSDGKTATGAALGTPVDRKVTIKPDGKAVTLTYSAKVTETGTFYIGATFTQGDQTFSGFSTTSITVGTTL